MSKKVEKISFFTPVVASKTTKNERFKTLGRFAENVWNFAGTKRGVKILHVSEVFKYVYVDASEKNLKKQNCFITLLKTIEFIALFPIIFVAKMIYRSQNDFYFVKNDHDANVDKSQAVDYQKDEKSVLEKYDIKPFSINDIEKNVSENQHEDCSIKPNENDSDESIESSIGILKAATIKAIEAVSHVIIDNDIVELVSNEGQANLSTDTKQDTVENVRAKTLKELDNEELKIKAQEAFDKGNYELAFKCSTIQISRFNQSIDLSAEEKEDLTQTYIKAIFSVSKIQKVRFIPKLENLKKKKHEELKKEFLKVCIPYLEMYQEADESIILKKLQSKNISLNTGEFDSINFDASSYSLINKVESFEIVSLDQGNAGVSFSQGKRASMEDRYLIQKIQINQKDQSIVEADFYAVFDGHGDLNGSKGDLCAEFARLKYAEVLSIELSKKDELSDLNVWNALKMSAVKLQDEWKKCNKQTFSGTTLCAAIILDSPDNKRKLWVINVGDSRAILSIKKSDNDLKVMQLSTDAKYDGLSIAKDYKTSLYKRHGILTLPKDQDYYRVGGENGLQVLRTIGNQDIQGLSARPEITCFDLSDFSEQKLTLLLATDGLTDCFGSLKAMQLIENLNNNLKSNALVGLALKHGSEDNITVMSIDLSI